MNNTNLVTWQDFKNTLEQHPNLILQFKYAKDQLVNANYHITEIKQAPIVAVDCGGVMNAWTEIIVQLWEPEQKDTTRAMEVKKALSIVSLVEKSLPLHPKGIVKIEFGNSLYDTRQLYPAAISIQGDELIVDLMPSFTECKAIGRGESCGVPSKPKIELAKLPGHTAAGTDSSSCIPGAGCC